MQATIVELYAQCARGYGVSTVIRLAVCAKVDPVSIQRGQKALRAAQQLVGEARVDRARHDAIILPGGSRRDVSEADRRVPLVRAIVEARPETVPIDLDRVGRPPLNVDDRRVALTNARGHEIGMCVIESVDVVAITVEIVIDGLARFHTRLGTVALLEVRAVLQPLIAAADADTERISAVYIVAYRGHARAGLLAEAAVNALDTPRDGRLADVERSRSAHIHRRGQTAVDVRGSWRLLDQDGPHEIGRQAQEVEGTAPAADDLPAIELGVYEGGAQAAYTDRAAGAAAAGDLDAGNALERLGDIDVRIFADVLSGDDVADGRLVALDGRRPRQRLSETGHDDFLQLVGRC